MNVAARIPALPNSRPEDRFRAAVEHDHRRQGRQDAVGYITALDGRHGVKVEWYDGNVRKSQFHPFPPKWRG